MYFASSFYKALADSPLVAKTPTMGGVFWKRWNYNSVDLNVFKILQNLNNVYIFFHHIHKLGKK